LGCQPNRSTAIRGARRTFSSCFLSVASTEAISDFTSTTRRLDEGGCQPSRSIDPRSPYTEYETSGAISRGVGSEELDAVVAEAGVNGIEEPVQIAASPSHREHELGVEPCEDPPEGPDGHPLDPAALEHGDLGLAKADAVSQISLSPQETVSQRATDASDSKVVHRATLAAGAYPAVIRGIGRLHGPICAK